MKAIGYIQPFKDHKYIIDGYINCTGTTYAIGISTITNSVREIPVMKLKVIEYADIVEINRLLNK